MTDIGVSCHKDSYGRTAGKPLGCTSDQEYDAGLCYEQCENDTVGVGPVCWGSCPAGTTECGGALCLEDGETCTQQASDIVTNAVLAAWDIAKH